MDDREAYEFYADPDNLQITGRARKHPKDKLTGMLSVRISPSLLSWSAAAAAAEGRSLGSWVRHVLMLARMTDARRARPQGLIVNSGRAGVPMAMGSSLGTLGRCSGGRTFSCPHLSIGNVVSAECEQCGPLRQGGMNCLYVGKSAATATHPEGSSS